MAWITLLLFNSALIVVPVSLGRAIFNAIPLLPVTHGIKCNGNGGFGFVFFIQLLCFVIFGEIIFLFFHF